MRKLIYSVFTLLTLSLIIAGCSGETYEKKLKQEKRAIKNYIADNGIKIIREYPSDHKFADDEFFLDDSTGVYMRVITPGNTEDPLGKLDDRRKVYVRFDSVYFMVKDDTYIGNNYAGSSPLIFTYGVTSTYLDNTGVSIQMYNYMSPACVLPLAKGLGSGAVVDLIIPFINGSGYQRGSYEPFKFTRMSYTYHTEEGAPKPESLEKE